jgi:hypothetical protein
MECARERREVEDMQALVEAVTAHGETVGPDMVFLPASVADELGIEYTVEGEVPDGPTLRLLQGGRSE